MSNSSAIPTIDILKQRAKDLRAERKAGNTITHSQSLELVAHEHGFRDWNTLRAVSNEAPQFCPVTPGERINGQYLGHDFEGEVLSAEILPETGQYQVGVRFDEPVDVVTHDSFSAFRRRVCLKIDRKGRTVEKTSDGQPHLVLNLLKTGWGKSK